MLSITLPVVSLANSIKYIKKFTIRNNKSRFKLGLYFEYGLTIPYSKILIHIQI